MKYFENKLLCGNCNGNGTDGTQEVCKSCWGTGIDRVRFFTVSALRNLEKQLSKEEITYSRLVEILNEKATKTMYDWISNNREDDTL